MAVSVLTILLFFVYLWGFGFSVLHFVRKPENTFELQVARIAVGLGIFSMLAIVLNFLHIPLDWKIFLAFSLIIPVYAAIKNKPKFPKFKAKISKESLYFVLAVFIALGAFYMYVGGAFMYPYLENEDPWGHSVGVKYVAMEKNAYDPLLNNGIVVDTTLSYIDPYPPAYNILMGVLHQTSPDLNWTLKFFNSLIIGLGILFFYLFARRFMGNRKKALFATFILAAIPSYLSHFIWAHSLVITLLFPSLYAFLMLHKDKRWWWVTAVLIGGVWVAQNMSQPLKITTMLGIYIVVVSIIMRKVLWGHIKAVVAGVVLSFLWWGVMIKKYTFQGFLSYFGAGGGSTDAVTGTASSLSIFSTLGSLWSSFTDPGGTASRAYTLGDIVYAKSGNLINNPIGVGVVLSLLTVVGVVYLLWRYRSKLMKTQNAWRSVALFWLIFTFWGINGITFGVSVARGAFRVWMLMAVAIAFVATEGLWFLQNFVGKSRILKFGVVALVIVGIIFTSGVQKYEHNTAIWPTSGAFSATPPETPFVYGEFFASLPVNSNVFLLSPRDKIVIGYGHFSCDWCQYVYDFRQDILFRSEEELYTFLTTYNYEYLVLNPAMDFHHLERYYAEETETLLNELYLTIQNSPRYTPVYHREGLIVGFKVN